MTQPTSKEEYAARRAVWLAALRSGDYKQGKGALHTIKNGEDSFCCLGLACYVTPTEIFTDVVTIPATDEEGKIKVFYAAYSSYLPPTAITYYGFRSTAGQLAAKDKISLAVLNDSQQAERWTFSGIADYVENNPSEVWVEGTY